MPLQHAWKITNSPDPLDKLACKMLIDAENASRTARNEANVETPGYVPEELLPSSNNTELKLSAEVICSATAVRCWDDYRRQAAERQQETGAVKFKDLRDNWAVLTEAERQQVAALAAQLAWS